MSWSRLRVTHSDRHLRIRSTESWTTPEIKQDRWLRNLCQNSTTSRLWWCQEPRDPKFTSHRYGAIKFYMSIIKIIIKWTYILFWRYFLTNFIWQEMMNCFFTCLMNGENRVENLFPFSLFTLSIHCQQKNRDTAGCWLASGLLFRFQNTIHANL